MEEARGILLRLESDAEVLESLNSQEIENFEILGLVVNILAS